MGTICSIAQDPCATNFGASSPPQSDPHMKSSGLLLIHHVSGGMLTRPNARNGLNLIWVLGALSSALIRASGEHQKHPKVNNHNTEQHSTTCTCIHRDFGLSEIQHSLTWVIFIVNKRKPRALYFEASPQRKIIGISRASFACSAKATAPPPS